ASSVSADESRKEHTSQSIRGTSCPAIGTIALERRLDLRRIGVARRRRAAPALRPGLVRYGDCGTSGTRHAGATEAPSLACNEQGSLQAFRDRKSTRLNSSHV